MNKSPFGFLRVAARWLFWPAVLVIIWGELTPRPPQLDSFLGWDKAQHFIAYGGLALMACLALGPGRRLLSAWLALVALGGALEILQAYTGRDPEVLDFVANTLGALGGLGLGLILWRLRGGALVAGRQPD